MTTQSGITIAEANAPYTIVQDLKTPKPGPKELLVKSVVVGINPVEPLMQHSGILVTSWPAILGSDASGVIVAVGDEVTRFKPGDYVYGCVRVGQNDYSPLQEQFLMDEDLAFRKGDDMSVEEAATVGAGLLTSALMLSAGTELEIPAPGSTPEGKDDWIIVMGGSGTVGQYAVQIARLCGYRVLAGCSPSRASATKAIGATETFDYSLPLEARLAEIQRITDGNFARFVDASAKAYELAIAALETVTKREASRKVYFATVDDWSPMDAIPPAITTYRVHLGVLGRDDGSHGTDTTNASREMIPKLEAHVLGGKIRPIPFKVVDGSPGWERVIEGIAALEKGNNEKLVARVADSTL